MEALPEQGKKALIIGGSGFLGRYLVERLQGQGYRVNVFDLRTTFEDTAVKFFIGDLCNKHELLLAMEGVYVVFHCATPPPLSNDHKLFYKVNYEGTETIIKACKEAGVKRLVLTSTASVIYQGKDIIDGKETLPYAKKPMDYYTQTKILQEKLVLEANSEDFFTVVIRPHAIFGPRDPHMVPTTIRTAQAGKMKFMIGKGENLVDFTYVVNVAHGHVLAAEKLNPGSPVCGKVYHVTNKAPIHFWAFLSLILVGLDYPAPRRKLPFFLVYFMALVVQMFVFLLRPIKRIRPTFTPISVNLASTHHYYNCDRATEDLGYTPVVPLDKAIAETVSSFSHMKNKLEKKSK